MIATHRCHCVRSTITKIAALILAHHRPDLLARLTDRLRKPLWRPYIHLDANSDITQFAVESVPRHRVTWGGFSTVRAILALCDEVLQDRTNTHFYLMSGQCYPIKTDDEIAATASECNCMSIIKMPVSHKPVSRLTEYDYHDGPVFTHRILRRLGLMKSRSVEELLRGMTPYGGSAWWLLDRPSMEAIYGFVQANPWLVRSYRFALAADEMFFQTLAVQNGVEAKRMSPTFAKWIEGEPHPLPLTPDIVAEAPRGWHLTARKFV